MRSANRFLSLLRVLGVLGALGSATGCHDMDFCTLGLCGGSGGAGGGTSTSSSGTTTTGTIAAECDPEKLAATASIDPTCGLFVEPGAADGDGSLGSPFGTIAEALANDPTSVPIYVCATGATVHESVELTGGASLIGGVTCGEWKASTMKTVWTADANEIPLTLTNTSGALVERFAITAAPASGFDATTLEGRSSISVLVNGGSASLLDVDITAGAGAAGGDGADQTGKAPGRQSDAASFDGNTGGDCNMPGGPATDYSACPAGGGLTEGGKGGNGGAAVGSAGDAGTPNPGMGPPQGTPGNGDTGVALWDCGTNLGNGEFGHAGNTGSGGPGGTGLGALDASGYHGPAGSNGTPGGIGQGGGGGGGRKASIDGCSTTGASGGSGGAGGCGGLAGAGGGAGGASIALVSLNATLTFTNVSLNAGTGGVGGAGGDGQLGGNGGVGGVGGGSACQGGSGGKGGDGGGGGGGKGGPSIGLASTGAAPAIDDGSITIAASASQGGAAGGGNVPGAPGDGGDLAKKKGF